MIILYIHWVKIEFYCIADTMLYNKYQLLTWLHIGWGSKTAAALLRSVPVTQIRFICLVVQLFTLLRLHVVQMFKKKKKKGTKQISKNVCVP